MTSIKSVFAYINLPDTEIDDMWIQEYASQALDAIEVSQIYEPTVCLLTVEDHKVSLPKDFRYLQAITYQHQSANSSQITKLVESVSNSTSEVVEEDGTRTITNTLTSMFTTPGDTMNQEHILRIQQQGVLNNYQLWFDSDLYRHNFHLMKAVPSNLSTSYHCTNCPNLTCSSVYEYSITPHRTIETSLKTGTICLFYLKKPTNDHGDLMIPDDQDLKMALAAYIKMRYAEEKMWMHEQNMFRLYYQFKQEWAKMAAKVKGKFLLKDIDLERLAYAHKPFTTAIRSAFND